MNRYRVPSGQHQQHLQLEQILRWTSLSRRATFAVRLKGFPVSHCALAGSVVADCSSCAGSRHLPFLAEIRSDRHPVDRGQSTPSQDHRGASQPLRPSCGYLVCNSPHRDPSGLRVLPGCGQGMPDPPRGFQNVQSLFRHRTLLLACTVACGHEFACGLRDVSRIRRDTRKGVEAHHPEL